MPNISIDVRKKTIQELINEEIPSGRYWLPSFQRQYVWDPDNIKELLDSIVQNYPIGATILWKPSPEIAAEIDPTSTPVVDGYPQKTKDRFFVIDGQQRMTSLLLLFNAWSIKRGGEQISCDRIAYDPVLKKFIKSKNKGIDFSEIVRAFCLHDVDMLSKLKNETNSVDFEQIRLVSNKILEYPIPQYVMETTGENDDIFSRMAEAFVRINKEGMRIGNVELMLSFMAGTLSGNLKNQVTKLYLDYEKSFGLAISPVIRFVFSNLGLSQTALAKPKQFAANLEKLKQMEAGEMQKRLEASERALKISVDFLRAEFGLQNARLVPSQTTILPIASYFLKTGLKDLAELPEEDRRDIASWFVLVNLNGHYSASVDTRLSRDIESIKQAAGFPLEELRAKMKVRKVIGYEDVADGLERNVLREANKALSFLLYVLLTKSGANDWGGQLLASRKYEDLEKHHIFPREYLSQQLELDDEDDPVKTEVVVSNLGNITFILGEVNSTISDTPPSQYLPDYIDSAHLHFIPKDPGFWTKEAYDGGKFQEERVRLIFEAAQKNFPKVFTKESPKKVKLTGDEISNENEQVSSAQSVEARLSVLPEAIRQPLNALMAKILAWPETSPAPYKKDWVQLVRGAEGFLWILPQKTQVRIYIDLTPEQEASYGEFHSISGGTGWLAFKDGSNEEEVLRLAKLSYDRAAA